MSPAELIRELFNSKMLDIGSWMSDTTGRASKIQDPRSSVE